MRGVDAALPMFRDRSELSVNFAKDLLTFINTAVTSAVSASLGGMRRKSEEIFGGGIDRRAGM